MTEFQPDLFTAPAHPNVTTPRARRSDPETSHIAGERLQKSGALREQQRTVLAALQRWPGCTAVEIAHQTGLDRYMVSRRLPELVPQYARRGPARACTVNNSQMTTWFPVPYPVGR